MEYTRLSLFHFAPCVPSRNVERIRRVCVRVGLGGASSETAASFSSLWHFSASINSLATLSNSSSAKPLNIFMELGLEFG